MADNADTDDFEAAGQFRPKTLRDVDPDYFTSTDDPELEFDEDGTELSASKEAELEAELDEGPPEHSGIYSHIPSLPWDVGKTQQQQRQAWLAAASNELNKDAEGGAFRSGAITPDGLIDEDFEKELGTPSSEDESPSEFSDMERFSIIEVAGDDLYGRKVIVVSACKLPSNKAFNHQRLLQYIKHTLDKYVEQDYVLVYFHYGLHRNNKPKLSWLLQAYREFDRKYKKNLKMLYLVHATNFIKVLWKIFRPIISIKFGQKVMYVDYLQQLRHHLPFDQLAVPLPVIEYDAKKVERNRLSSPVDSAPKEEKKAQQFGLSLTEIKENTGHIIPKPVEDTIEYLKSVQGDEVQGLFRRCARVSTMREVQERYDDGETVDFTQYGDPHLAGAILKKFLRELSEPLMTFDLFEPITRLHYMEPSKQVFEVQRILKDELPEDNYIILKYIYQFLQQVVTKSEVNLMTSANMATVFGPNIAWPKGQANLSNVEQAVKFSLILLDSFDDVFLR